MSITEKILQKKREAARYSSKFNNQNPFFVLASYKNAVLTNSSVAKEELCKNGYSVVSSFINGEEVK